MCVKWMRLEVHWCHRLMLSNSISLRVKNLHLRAIHCFKLQSKPKSEMHPHTKKKNTLLAFIIWNFGAPSCLSGVFMSFGVPQQSNSNSNSCASVCWDSLWWPNSSASIPNECQPLLVFSCGLSAVCPLVEERMESTQQPPSPPLPRKGDFIVQGPTASC